MSEDDDDIFDFESDKEVELISEKYSHQATKDKSSEVILGSNGPAMFRVISKVENFLLPSHDDRYWSDRGKGGETMLCPKDRLDQILFQLAIADHIRLMQSLYRDNEDDQMLEQELRFENPSAKLPNKALMERITEGRSRVVALCKLCYGEETIETLRAQVDLANSYASQGMWVQVSEHMTSASQRLFTVYTRRRTEAFEQAYRKARSAACRIACVFTVLREHAMKNFGEVRPSIVDELQSELNVLENEQAMNTNYQPPPPSDYYDGNNNNSAPTQRIQLASLLESFFEKNKNKTKSIEDNINNNDNNNNTVSHSWGDIVDFFRRDCGVMTSWLAEINSVTLPQHKAILHLAFQLADVQRKGVVHPTHFVNLLSRFPAAAKAVAGSQFISKISKIKVQVPIYVALDEAAPSGVRAVGNVGGERIDYELPLTWEEVLAMSVNEVQIISNHL